MPFHRIKNIFLRHLLKGKRNIYQTPKHIRKMKKIILMAAAVAAFTFTSCGGNNTSDANAENADTTAVEGEDALTAEAVSAAEEATSKLDAVLSAENADPAKVTEAVQAIEQKVKELQESGNVEAAAAYASKVKTYIEENKEKLQSIDPSSLTVVDLVNAAANLPQSAKDAASDAVEAVTGDASSAKAAGEAAVESAKSAAKSAVNEAKTNVENAAKAKVEEGKAKVQQKADEAVQKGAKKASDAVNKALGL